MVLLFALVFFSSVTFAFTGSPMTPSTAKPGSICWVGDPESGNFQQCPTGELCYNSANASIYNCRSELGCSETFHATVCDVVTTHGYPCCCYADRCNAPSAWPTQVPTTSSPITSCPQGWLVSISQSRKCYYVTDLPVSGIFTYVGFRRAISKLAASVRSSFSPRTLSPLPVALKTPN